MYGNIIKIIMITASGAEGISLKNVRNVHITEPYWHPVRMEQVIGRARRICSHQDLPKELRTVDVYLYLMKFTEYQISEDMMTMEMRLNDARKDKDKKEKNKDVNVESEVEKKDVDKKSRKINLDTSILTSDETLHDISVRKKELTSSILKAVKESAIDCTIHNKGSENLQCYKFISENENNVSYNPEIEKDKQLEMDLQKNVKEMEKMISSFKIKDKQYYTDKKNIYDAISYETTKELVKVGSIDSSGRITFDKK
jgi:hypothetical protein